MRDLSVLCELDQICTDELKGTANSFHVVSKRVRRFSLLMLLRAPLMNYVAPHLESIDTCKQAGY